MLNNRQMRSIERMTMDLGTTVPGATPEVGVDVRQRAIAISKRTVLTEWGEQLPDPTVSEELLIRLVDISPIMARLAYRRLTLDELFGCWSAPLTAETDSKGRARYPNIADPSQGGKTMRVHRYVWRTLVDPLIDSGTHLDHLCRVHACCNITHLEPVTLALNTQRGNHARIRIGGQGTLFD